MTAPKKRPNTRVGVCLAWIIIGGGCLGIGQIVAMIFS